MKRLIIFDFDGVIADTLELYEKATREKLTELGYDFVNSHEELMELFDENIIHALVKHGVNTKDLIVLWQHLNEVASSNNIRLCDGISEAIPKLAKACELAIVSSNATEVIRGVVEKHDLAPYFAMIMGGEDISSKSDHIKRAMQSASTKASDTFYVGDTVGDIHEARTAGVVAVAAAWGWHSSEHLSDASPDFVIEKPDELDTIINKK